MNFKNLENFKKELQVDVEKILSLASNKCKRHKINHAEISVELLSTGNTQEFEQTNGASHLFDDFGLVIRNKHGTILKNVMARVETITIDFE